MENLRRLADRVAANKAARELANRCCDDLEQYSIAVLEELAERMRRRGVEGVFLAQMAQRLQTTLPGSRVMVKTWLQTVVPYSPAVLLQQRAEQAADNLKCEQFGHLAAHHWGRGLARCGDAHQPVYPPHARQPRV